MEQVTGTVSGWMTTAPTQGRSVAGPECTQTSHQVLTTPTPSKSRWAHITCASWFVNASCTIYFRDCRKYVLLVVGWTGPQWEEFELSVRGGERDQSTVAISIR